jgi:hypothetical protein
VVALVACACKSQPAPKAGAPEPVAPRDAGILRPAEAGAAARVLPPAPAAPAPAPPSDIKLTIRATPRMKVYWGKQLLGLTPLILPRPRDSGPMDLTLKADGYIPEHVRIYTYKDDVLVVKPVKLTDKMTVLGARQEIPPETEPDAGVPPLPAPSPP